MQTKEKNKGTLQFGSVGLCQEGADSGTAVGRRWWRPKVGEIEQLCFGLWLGGNSGFYSLGCVWVWLYDPTLYPKTNLFGLC